MPKKTNWHLAARNALQIDLREYADILEYLPEYVIQRKGYRIDLLVIRKRMDLPIQKLLASHFKETNLFEIKGIHTTLNIRSFFKTIGYACAYMESQWGYDPHIYEHLTLNFLSHSHPKKLLGKLQKKYGFTLEKTSSGIYDVTGGIFPTRFIITRDLPSDDYLYLRCLTDQLSIESDDLRQKLLDNIQPHQSEPLYREYLYQLFHANALRKGDDSMTPTPTIEDIVCALFNTSPEEIRNEVEAEYAPKLQELQELQKQVAQLRQILLENGIPDPFA